MRAAHGLALSFVVIMGVLLVTVARSWTAEGGEDPSNPDLGTLAPLGDRPPRAEAVAVIPGAAGSVVDLVARDGVLAVLTGKNWYLVRGESLLGGFGESVPGAPGWLSRPASIALGPEGVVYVLDAGRRTVLVWDSAGTWVEDLPVPAGDALSHQPVQVVVGPGGTPLVLSFLLERDGAGRWVLQAVGPEASGQVLLSIEARPPAGLFDRPYLAYAGAELLGFNALDHTVLLMLPEEGKIQTRAVRPAPPLWYVPHRIRRQYQTMLAGMGVGTVADVSRLPDIWPSVRDVTVRPDGSILLAITAGEDRQHVEVLDASGVPVRRFNPNGYEEPVFLDGGRAFMVEEAPEMTVVYELVSDDA